MTVFTTGDVIIALAVGLAVGLSVGAGFKSQHKSNAETLRALQQRMGPLYNVGLFASGALPAVAMMLVGSLRGAPTPLDAIVLVVLIGVGMVASYTLLGNALKLTDVHVRQ